MCPEPDRCNRRPFQSGDGCDRGNVDVTQFDDFPYCNTIDPTDPQVPPEIVDAPMSVLLPAYSCSCINIKYKFDFKYSRSRDFVASGSFSADGDCCEGNYGTTMNLQIPCPVLSGGDKKIKMSIGYGDGAGSFEGDLISADASNCTIAPHDVTIRLDIPCPVIGSDASKQISARIKYGSGGASDAKKYMAVNPTDCKIEALDAALSLEIPCPVVDGDKKIKIGISYGDGFNGASAKVVRADHERCTIEPNEADFNLSIPCPLPNISIKAEYSEVGSSAETGMTVTSSYNQKDCRKTFTIKTAIPNFAVNVPCPVQGGEDEVTMEVKYGGGSGFKGQLIAVDHDTCTVSTVSNTISLSIPCPVKIPLSGTGLSSLNAHMKLGISYFGGLDNLGFESFSDDFILTDLSDCGIQAKSINAKLHIPCPVNKTGLKIETEIDGDASGASFGLDDEFDVQKCERRLKFKVKFPEMKGNASGSAWIGGNVEFETASDANVQVTTYNDNGTKKVKIGVYYV